MGRLCVKVCCIESPEEAAWAIDAGADALGLVSNMPSGPGVIGERRIAEIVATVPPNVATFLLTSERDPGRIVAQQRRCGVNTLQLVDRVSADVRCELRSALPGISLVQVVHVEGEHSLEEACVVSKTAHVVLLDSGRHDAPVRELGGTGRTYDWVLSRAIVDSVNVPVFLAGGLNPGNVAQAIKAVQPFGVDLCTGVRTGGRLDVGKLGAFMGAVRAASGD